VLFCLLRDWRFVDHPEIAQETGHSVGWPGADAEPVFDPLVVELQPLGVVLGDHRVVGADSFDVAPVAGLAGIRHDDAVIGALFGAAA